MSQRSNTKNTSQEGTKNTTEGSKFCFSMLPFFGPLAMGAWRPSISPAAGRYLRSIITTPSSCATPVAARPGFRDQLAMSPGEGRHSPARFLWLNRHRSGRCLGARGQNIHHVNIHPPLDRVAEELHRCRCLDRIAVAS